MKLRSRSSVDFPDHTRVISMHIYELLYIIPTTFTDEEIGGVEQKIAGLLTKYQATIESTQRLGKFKLAYAIDKQRHGHYVMVLFKSEPAMMAKIDENLRITNEILRHLIVKVEEGDQKFDLVQFMEVDVNSKDDKKKSRSDKKKTEAEEEVKEGKEEKEEDKEEAVEKDELSDAEKAEALDKKIEEALKADEKTV